LQVGVRSVEHLLLRTPYQVLRRESKEKPLAGPVKLISHFAVNPSPDI